LAAVTVLLLIIAAIAAVGDWVAVHLRLFRIEFLLKPMTLALLVAAASVSHLGPAKPWLVAALVCGLLGDVGLMLSKSDSPDPPFLAGLGAFLLGHVCYLIAFTRAGLHGLQTAAGALIAAGVAGLLLPAVLRGAARTGGRLLATLVGAYASALAAVTTLGVGTGHIATALGASLFLTSDAILGRERFVRRIPHGDLLVITTYHAAQFLILIGLVRRW
jgi:uncharacterized membrane protein YhhN